MLITYRFLCHIVIIIIIIIYNPILYETGSITLMYCYLFKFTFFLNSVQQFWNLSVFVSLLVISVFAPQVKFALLLDTHQLLIMYVQTPNSSTHTTEERHLSQTWILFFGLVSRNCKYYFLYFSLYHIYTYFLNLFIIFLYQYILSLKK
jgi:hypothetical protein